MDRSSTLTSPPSRRKRREVLYRTNPWARLYWHENGECILFPTVDRDGYGLVSTWDPLTQRKSSHKASRYIWQQIHGPLPRSIEVCHVCDVRSCIRPSHLFIDDHAGNMRDAARKARMVQRLTWDQVLAIRSSDQSASWLAHHFACHIRTIYDIKESRRRFHPPIRQE